MSEDTEEDAGGGIDLETLKSYASFLRRSLRKRTRLIAGIAALGTLLTVLVYKFLPRTYVCRTVLMGQAAGVLDNGGWSSPFAGASDLIMRHDNLEAIIREIGLAKTFPQRRAPLPALKDQVFERLFGKGDDEDLVAALVGTLEAKVEVNVDGNTLAITVGWTDGKSAAEIAAAARDSYVKTRHAGELSAFQEKMGILDGHATRVRQEVDALAQEIRAMHEDNVARAKASAAAAASAAPQAVTAPRRVVARRAEQADPQLPALREKLETLKRRYADIQGDSERRLRDERAKLADLKLRFAPSHPDVVTAEQRIAMLSREPSDVAVLRADIKNLESDIEQRLLARAGETSVATRPGTAQPTAAGAEPIPAEIVRLLDEDDTDPVLATQLAGAIRKYGGLRDDIRSARIDLDTAQAAFNHRYKLIVPAEVPSRPSKPKGILILGGGLALTLLLALLAPILAELRRGIITERWQVQQLHLPVLGELRLPASTSDSGPEG